MYEKLASASDVELLFWQGTSTLKIGGNGSGCWPENIEIFKSTIFHYMYTW